MSNIIVSLGIRGISTTSNMAKFVLSYNMSAGYEAELEYNQVRKLGNDYSRLLTKGVQTKRSRTNRDKRSPGLVSSGYAFVVDKVFTGKIMVPRYFLTLKGAFLVLGFNFSDEELIKIIKNIAKISLYFAYINKILEKTSIQFIKKMFIEPIREVIEKTNFFDRDIKFYFVNIVDLTGINLQKKMEAIHTQKEQDILDKPLEYFYSLITIKNIMDSPNVKLEDMLYSKMQEAIQDEHCYKEYLRGCGIESIMDNTFYYFRLKNDWADSLIDYFYQDKDSNAFYREHHDENDLYLVYKIMEKIHFTYYSYFGYVPSKPKVRLRRSKRWKKHVMYKNSSGKF